MRDPSLIDDNRPVMSALIGISGDERGCILRANEALGQLLGCAADDLVGAAIWDFIRPEDRQRAALEFARVVARSSDSSRGVARVVCKDTSLRWVRLHANLTSSSSTAKLLVHAVALPVRLVDDGARRRGSANDALNVALDVQPVVG